MNVQRKIIQLRHHQEVAASIQGVHRLKKISKTTKIYPNREGTVHHDQDPDQDHTITEITNSVVAIAVDQGKFTFFR